MLFLIKILFIIHVFFISSVALAYQWDQPSKPGSQMSWWLDHKTKQEYFKNYENLKKQEELKRQEHLQRIKENRPAKPINQSTIPSVHRSIGP
ncbi:MAG: hypothetical protein ABII18_11765 [bacterium]